MNKNNMDVKLKNNWHQNDCWSGLIINYYLSSNLELNCHRMFQLI